MNNSINSNTAIMFLNENGKPFATKKEVLDEIEANNLNSPPWGCMKYEDGYAGVNQILHMQYLIEKENKK